MQAVGGKLLTGPLLADLVTRMVEALNSRWDAKTNRSWLRRHAGHFAAQDETVSRVE